MSSEHDDTSVPHARTSDLAVDVDLWTPRERRRWKPRLRLTPDQWATAHRILEPGQSSKPGPWRHENAPYLRGFMKLAAAPGVVEINFMKAAQIGVSEAMRNIIGAWITEGPDPIALALPNKNKGRSIVRRRFIPMVRSTPILSELMTERSADLASEQLAFNNGCLMHLMWAGSATSMASEPVRRAICDEVDKFETWSQREAHAVYLVAKRLRTYEHKRMQINVSTPTTEDGMIFRLFEGSDVKLYFKIACPTCAQWFIPRWQLLKWRKLEGDQKKAESRDAMIKRLRREGVWLECPHCEHHIDDRARVAALREGRWATEDDSIHDAEQIPRWPQGTTIGMHASAVHCTWITAADIAVEFIKARGNPAAMFTFITDTLGEVFKSQVRDVPASALEAKIQHAKREGWKKAIVPRWCGRLIASIDTQHDHFYVVIRAWGPEMRSRRVWHGVAYSFAELDDMLWRKPWAIESGGSMIVDLAGIDSGGTKLEDDSASRTIQVYQWAEKRKARVRPLKGSSRPMGAMKIKAGKGWMDHSTRSKHRKSLVLWFLDSHHFHDELQDMIDSEKWELNDDPDPVYIEHLTNAVRRPVRRGTMMHSEWVPKIVGDRIDYRDVEAYQVALAYMALVHTLPSAEEIELQRAALRNAAPKPRPPAGGAAARKHDPWSV